jgi:hypothetical protein
MIVLRKYYNEEYISPEDKIEIYHSITSLYYFWINVLHKYSNYKLKDLPDKQFNQISFFNNFAKLKLDNDISIGIQLDKEVVKVLLWACNISGRKSTVYQIFEKTKSSIDLYFHYELLIESFLFFESYDYAEKVVKTLFLKDKIAYYSYISNLDKIDNEKFKLKISYYIQQSKLKLNEK